MSDGRPPRFLISTDRGATWRPMPEHWRQEGRITASSPEVVVQAAGRGREIWYAVGADDEDDQPPS